MNTNLYTKELARNRKNLFTWTAIVLGLTLMVLAIYPYMAEMGDGMSQLMESIPAEISKAIGMDANTWKSILGFYSTYYGIYIIVLISIYTASTGATILSKEEKDRTAEFLLTRPISRQTIFTTKMMSLLSLSLIIYTVQTLIAIISMTVFSEESINWSTVAIMHLNGLILVLFFTTSGVLISMLMKPKKNFMGIVVGITFGSYFLNAIAKSTEATQWLGYFSPFHYLDFSINDPNYAFNVIPAGCILLISMLMLFIAAKRFQLKDIEG